MTRPIPTRFSDYELEVLDCLVRDGVGATRSEVIRRAVTELDDARRRSKVGKTIAADYRARPQTREDDLAAMANAVAMVEAEPW